MAEQPANTDELSQKTRSADNWAAWLAPIIIILINVMYYLADSTFLVSLFTEYAGLLIAMASGLFGAASSMLVARQKRISQESLADLRETARWKTLVIRGAFGLGAATILYFFFRSGVLGQTPWPQIENLGFTPITEPVKMRVPNVDLGLLVIWCFLAGFSETLVPNILDRTEKKAAQE